MSRMFLFVHSQNASSIRSYRCVIRYPLSVSMRAVCFGSWLLFLLGLHASVRTWVRTTTQQSSGQRNPLFSATHDSKYWFAVDIHKRKIDLVRHRMNGD